MIIIIGSHDDLRCGAVIGELLRQKIAFSLFNTQDFPYMTRIAIDIDGGGSITPAGGAKIPLAEVKSVYYCTNNHFRMLEEDPPEIRHIIYNNIESACWSFFRSLDCLFINPIDPANLHQYKGYLLKIFRQQNLRVPNTLITNDADAILAFYEKNKGSIVCKPPWGQAFTEKVTPAHLTPESLGKLTNSPVMLQEYIPGQDFRAYVLGDRIFGVEIRSSTLDLNLDDTAERVAVNLPDGIADDCRKLAKASGLIFTAIDFRRTPEGEHVFFEANSSPDFTTDEGWTHYPLSASLVEVLAKG